MKVRIGIAALLIALVATTGVWAQSSYEKHPGFVDKQAFLSSVDDDDVMIEIWLPGSLLGIVKGVDEELGDLVDGLELAQAVVVEARGSGKAEKLDEQLKQTEAKLMKRGWVRLAKIQDGGENIRILILNGETTIDGLAVMISDKSSGEFIFANVAGTIDLAAIQRLGQKMDIPGLDQIEVD